MNNSCRQCGRPLIEGSAFCKYCGARVEPMKQAVHVPTGSRCLSCGAYVKAGEPYCPVCGRPSAGPGYPAASQPRRRASHTPLYLSLTAFILAVVLTLGLWRPGFLWALKAQNASGSTVISGEDSDLAELLAGEAVYNPSEIPVSGTPALTVSPADGITVSAEENALDKERTFTADPLTESEMGKLFIDRSTGDWAPVYAFEFDAGLEDDERLPGELTIKLDLDELGIDEELLPYLSVMRFGDDGTVMQLPTSVTDDGISFTTRQNCILSAVITGLSIGIPVMAYIERGQDGLDKLYPNEIFYEAVYPELQKANAQYRVAYPQSMARTDSPELKALDDRMRAVIEKYGLDPDRPLVESALEIAEYNATNPEFENVDTYSAAYRLMEYVYTDPEYISVKATFNDPQWQLRNLWPDSVANVVNRLARADAYLFGERDFRVPTHVIDVLVLDRWPHGAEMLGVSKNLYTSSPYIHFNASKTSDLQNLLVTTTHELFHVVQSGYVYFDSGNYTPFWEATAVLLEKEAFDYYVANQMIGGGQTTLLTDRNMWELYDNPLMMPSKWENVSNTMQYMQDQGYVASHWIEFLKMRYYNSDDFMKQLMERFAATYSTLDSDVHKALMNQTSSDKTTYCSDFRLFCIQNFSNFNGRSAYAVPKPASVTLSADDPYVKLEMPYQAFSSRIQDIQIQNTDANGDAQTYKVLVEGEAPGSVEPAVRFYQSSTYKAQLTGDGMLLLPESTGKSLTIHEIEDYFMTTPGATVGTGYTYELHLMLPPAAPTVEIDTEKDLMRLTPQGFSLSDDLSAGYDVVVINPEGDEFHFPQDVDTDEAEIPLDELESDKKDAETDADKYTIYLIEKVEFPDGSLHYGPDGEKFEQDDELRFEDILGTYDMTQSVSGFGSDVLDDVVGQMEGVEGLEEYMEQYNQYMGNVDGEYAGTMVIKEYQPGTQIADISFYYPEYEEATTTYRGTWDNGVLHIESVTDALSGNWDLTFRKESGTVTCAGTLGSDSDVAAYNISFAAVKQD